MFELGGLPSVEGIGGCADAGLVEVIGAAQRMERAAAARRLFAIGELFARREAEQDAADRQSWRIDGWDYVAAEVAAAQGVSRHKAAAQIRLASALREDLPKVAEVFVAGLVDEWVIATIVSRTLLVDSGPDMARIDAGLARRVQRWNRLSKKKVIALVDSWVVTIDALAKRRARTRDEDRHIGVGADCEGIAEIWGRLRAPDAAALDARLTALAATVCPADPRTSEQRRADAAGALAAGAERLGCQCGHPDCPAGGYRSPAVVIHVVADAATVTGGAPIPGYINGYGVLPAEMVRALLPAATVRRVDHPLGADAENGYRPSRALAEFIRCRDLTCRFPDCDAPAEVCDIDHTMPWPYGPTHASNLKLLCRHHHLLKTFLRRWSDRQSPDGTITWTSPTGHTYTTKPGGALLFPQLAHPTRKLVLPNSIPASAPGRELMMPTRQRTRAQDRQARIDYERTQNQLHLPAPPPPDCGPPPF